ncbi:1-aminocyclopropane-1-carboxylate synthase-like protein 1 [Tolypocladium paradoxum]|uniref:1-aminocyclopropane-1-carboxylate synthase-like protein 1 n=1 Tax=Tolypocladium paradoxum TaxID=94208 RepID=A0A2S4KYP5_9HYPO|nr:1-aminocyclopropane-1-carboxylate synthase-like protein 1 [Tolypocladium paradoxum]
MAELSSRMQRPASAILPKIAATIAERTGTTRKIDLATAENWLIRPELVEIYKDAIEKSLTTADLSYPDGFGGDPRLQEALATFFNKYFHPVSLVKPQDIVVAPGASNCLDSLLFSLCEAGDSVLVLAPYWNGFDFHFVLRPNVNIIPVYTESAALLDRPSDLLSESLVPALASALESCDDKSRVKAFAMTNPHNPMARCYPEHVLREAIHWCAEQGLHYVSDEVYALSDFSNTATSANGTGVDHEVTPAAGTGTEPNGASTNGSRLYPETRFVSALSLKLDADKTPPISIIWSTSKDLGSSGLRMGVHVLRARRSLPEGNGHSGEDGPAESGASASLLSTSLGLLSTPQLPTISMLLTRSLLTSGSFDALVVKNRQRLRENHDLITRRLQEWSVPFIPATSGPYLLVHLGVGVGDLQRQVRKNDLFADSGKGEQDAAAKRQKAAVAEASNVVDVLRHKAMVLVSPGKAFHMRGVGADSNTLDGWVRITFAVPTDVLEDGLSRIGEALGLEGSK